MYGRCLSKGRANITDAEARLRDNVHQFSAYLYGVYQELPITETVAATLHNDLRSSIWVYINKTVPLTAHGDIRARIELYINKILGMEIRIPFKYRLEKAARINIPQTIQTIMDVTMLAFYPQTDIIASLSQQANSLNGMKLGIVKLKLISEIESLYVSDIENLLIKDIIYTRVI